MSCAGNGYLSGNELVPFPFEDGQCLAWDFHDPNEAQLALNRCFVDAASVIRSKSIEEVGWPSIGLLSIVGSSLAFSICCGNDRSPILVSRSGERFPIVSGDAPWGSYVVVMSSEGVGAFIDFCNSNGVSPPSSGRSSPSEMDGDFFLRLCPKCVTLVSEGLSSIRVYDGVRDRESGPHFTLTGDVSIRPGNNMLLTEPDGTEGIGLSAVPGAGLGVVPCRCETEPGVSLALSSPDGHVRLFNDTCYDLEPCETVDIVVDGEARKSKVLRIHEKCTACCTCSMYESIVNDRLAALADTIRQAKADLDGLIGTYEHGVQVFNRRISHAKLKEVKVSMSGMPIGANLSPKMTSGKVKGKLNRCAFTATLKNTALFKIYATVSSLSSNGTVVEAATSWSTQSGTQNSRAADSASEIKGRTYAIYPGRSMSVTFVSVKKDMVSSVKKMKTGNHKGKISFSISNASGHLGTISRTVSVLG